MTDTITNDITTRLLAQENLLIHRAPVRTASFDVKNRVLTLPQWQNMTPEIEEMLKAHEVGHALYTDEAIFEARRSEANAQGIPFGYLNILEDVRIERIMKNNFPGLRKTFTEGYRQLVDMDFFETRNKDLSKLGIADKINLYFKVGYKSGVKFTTTEQQFVDEAGKAETIEQVVDLSRRIYEYAVEQKKKKQDALMADSDFVKMLGEARVTLEDDEEGYDFDDGENEDDSPSGAGGGADESKDNIGWDNKDVEEPLTLAALERKLQAQADVNSKFIPLGMPNFNGYFDDIIIPYKTILKYNENAVDAMCKSAIERGYEYRVDNIKARAELAEKEYEKFQVETTKVVAYLVKEFEMRKAASNYKRTQISKTGVLDVTKLASYKIREDLFKQIAITKDGQKHGMLFVLDWSGSMNDYLEETVKQLISLAQFCYRVRIPFQVFAFSDNSYLASDDLETTYSNGKDASWDRRLAVNEKIAQQSGNNYLRLAKYFSMLELLSSKMTPSEFKRGCRTLFMMSAQICFENFETHGTPLNEALAFMYDYVGEFKKTHNVEKLTMIKLTDGDGGNVNYYSNRVTRLDGQVEERDTAITHMEYCQVEGKRFNLINTLVDKYTKRTYNIEKYTTVWGNVLTEIIRDRYECNVIGFHVVKTNPRHLHGVLSTYGVNSGDSDVYTVRRDLTKEQFAAVKVAGHDEMFLLRSNMKVDDTQLVADMKDMSAAAIARNFTKHMSGKKTSRVLLNRFIGVVA